MAKQRGHRANKANDNNGTIDNDSLYRGKYREDVYQDEDDTEEGPSEEATPEEDAPKTIAMDDGSSDYKKRYDDLKRHYDSKLEEWRKEKDSLLQAQQAGAAHGVAEEDLPRTAAQLEQFKNKYPEVYQVMTTISSQRAEEKLKSLQEEVASLRSREKELEAQSAFKELLNRHPDFNEIKKDPKFISWLDDQPQSISDGVYHNNTDAKWASRVIDLYKADMGIRTQAKRTSNSDAAAAVRTPSAKDVVGSNSGDKRIWKASEIGRLKAHEFEKYEAELDAARAEGRIDYNK